MEIKFVKSEKMELVGGAGLALVGQILNRCTTLGKDLTRQFPKRTGAVPTGDVALAYVATLCTGPRFIDELKPSPVVARV